MSWLKRRPRPEWMPGNRVELLENGEAYFPAVLDAISTARHEVLIETFILFEDKVGMELQRALIEAARRGVRVDMTVDGWGSIDLSKRYLAALADAGVCVRMFDPQPRVLGLRLHVFRRMHRKIVVVDGRIAFVGGINFSRDHLDDFGPQAKQDYSVSIEGPLVPRIRRFVLGQIGRDAAKRPSHGHTTEQPGSAEVMFVPRDNRHQRDAIERQYRAAIHAARRDVIIASAYFFPGYRLLRAMRRAVRRGVRVRLILQGEPDMKIVKHAAKLLHPQLISAGIEIFEYCKRPMHAKIALVDEDWSTVGSSNLDPLSLSLNLEANVMIRERAFNADLRDRLERLINEDCRQLEPDAMAHHNGGWRVLLDTLAYHATRRFPAWAGYLPAHVARLERAVPARSDRHPDTVWRPH
jgi:cardiolipin synthase A/B